MEINNFTDLTEFLGEEYTKNADAKLPDAIIYEYVGGTYVKK